MTKPADSDQIAKARRISPDVLETARGYMAGKEPTLELMASFALAWQRLAVEQAVKEECAKVVEEFTDGEKLFSSRRAIARAIRSME